ncbi:MAG: hypothetical protein IBX58_16640 [Roseovarius sp.]|nr:hypothetical protein [Roseovarius sp.]
MEEPRRYIPLVLPMRGCLPDRKQGRSHYGSSYILAPIEKGRHNLAAARLPGQDERTNIISLLQRIESPIHESNLARLPPQVVIARGALQTRAREEYSGSICFLGPFGHFRFDLGRTLGLIG